MTEKSTEAELPRLSKRAKLFVLPTMVVVTLIVIVTTIGLIVAIPTYNARQQGVGANGFRSGLIEDGADLGLSKAVPKSLVTNELGDKAIKVAAPKISDVINLNGTRGQTVTFPFIRKDGLAASVYVDTLQFNNSDVMASQNIYSATQRAGQINGYPAYFMHALTFGTEREYRLMLVDGLKVYKLVLTQPSGKVTIPEVSALAVLKKIAEKSEL